MNNVMLALEGAWKVLAVSLVLGAGLPMIFALGISSLALGAGGDLNSNVGPATPPACSPAGAAAILLPPATYYCNDDIPGVGQIVTRWQISTVAGTGRMVFIQVRSEGTGALSRRRSRAEFTTFRSCTDATPVSTAASLLAKVGITVAA